MAAFWFLLRRGQLCKQPPYTVKCKFMSRIGYGLKKVKVLSPRLFDVEERWSLVCCVSWIHVWCGRHERRRTLLRRDEPMKHSRGFSEVCSLSLVGSSLSLHPKFIYTHTPKVPARASRKGEVTGKRWCISGLQIFPETSIYWWSVSEVGR